MSNETAITSIIILNIHSKQYIGLIDLHMRIYVCMHAFIRHVLTEARLNNCTFMHVATYYHLDPYCRDVSRVNSTRQPHRVAVGSDTYLGIYRTIPRYGSE